MLAYLVISVLAAVIVGLIAQNRGKPFLSWFLCALIIWPLALILALRLPRQPQTQH